MDFETEIIKHYLNKLDKKTLNIFTDGKIKELIKKVCEDNLIPEEKRDEVGTEIILFILKIINTQELEKKLIILGLDTDKAKKTSKMLEESINTTQTTEKQNYSGGVEVIEEKIPENELLLEAPEKEDILAGIENPISTPNYSPRINVGNMVTNKLNSVVSTKTQAEKIDFTKKETAKRDTPIQKNYARDPYREPLE